VEYRGTFRQVLNNGIVVIATENPAADIIAARIFFRSGSRYEPREKSGISNLLAAVLTKGTGKLSSLEIAEKVESVGARLSADTTSDYFLVGVKTVSEDFADILKLTGELIRNPSFPETEIELEKRIAIQGIRSQLEQPFAVAFSNLREIVYRDHPYALSTLGTEETLASINRADILNFHQTYFRPDNMIISIAGRIVPEEAIALVEKVFGDWQPPAQDLPNLTLPKVNSQPCESLIPQDTQQSIVMLAYLASKVKNPDYATLKLLNTYLGNGLSSRLFVELREKRGLAYDVSAFYPTRIDDSYFVVYMGTSPQNTAIAREGLKMEVDRLVTIPLDEEELQAAKNKLLGQYALGKQTNGQIAQIFGWYETLGLGIDFDDRFQENVAAVTAEVAQEVARKYFADPYVSIVGPKEANGEQLTINN